MNKKTRWLQPYNERSSASFVKKFLTRLNTPPYVERRGLHLKKSDLKIRDVKNEFTLRRSKMTSNETSKREGHRTEKGSKDVPNLSGKLSDSSNYRNQGIQGNKAPEKEKEPIALKKTGGENISQGESQNETEEGQDDNKNKTQQFELNEYEIMIGLKSKGIVDPNRWTDFRLL